MHLHRLRIVLEDSPGSLGRAAAALGGIGVNILHVELHRGEQAGIADDFLVDLTVPIDLPAVESVLRDVGCRVEDLAPADAHELVDPTTRALELASAIVTAPDPGARLADVASRLVRSELSWVVDPGSAGADGVVAAAASRGEPVQGREAIKLLPTGSRPPWVLAVPVPAAAHRADRRGERSVLAVARRRPAFSMTETARLQALARLAATPRPAPTGEVVTLSDGGAVELRPLRPEDDRALERLHARCSKESLYLRYFRSVPRLRPHLLRFLLDVDGTERVGIVAATGTEIVGTARLVRLEHEPGVAEVAFLVEDAHQRRGIGRLMLERLLDHAAAHRVEEVVAYTLPENRALPRLLRSAGHGGPARWEHGVLRFAMRPRALARGGT